MDQPRPCIVEVTQIVPAEDVPVVAARVAERLAMPVERVQKLIDARTGPITRPLRPDKAEAIAQTFEAAGVVVAVRLATDDDEPEMARPVDQATGHPAEGTPPDDEPAERTPPDDRPPAEDPADEPPAERPPPEPPPPEPPPARDEPIPAEAPGLDPDPEPVELPRQDPVERASPGSRTGARSTAGRAAAPPRGAAPLRIEPDDEDDEDDDEPGALGLPARGEVTPRRRPLVVEYGADAPAPESPDRERPSGVIPALDRGTRARFTDEETWSGDEDPQGAWILGSKPAGPSTPDAVERAAHGSVATPDDEPLVVDELEGADEEYHDIGLPALTPSEDDADVELDTGPEQPDDVLPPAPDGWGEPAVRARPDDGATDAAEDFAPAVAWEADADDHADDAAAWPEPAPRRSGGERPGGGPRRTDRPEAVSRVDGRPVAVDDESSDAELDGEFDRDPGADDGSADGSDAVVPVAWRGLGGEEAGPARPVDAKVPKRVDPATLRAEEQAQRVVLRRTLMLWALVVAVIVFVLAQFWAGGRAAAGYGDGLHRFRDAQFAAARSVWTRLASEGDPNAQFMLGYMSETGLGQPWSARAAASWYRLAADAGHAEAQWRLGSLYDRGLGVPRSVTDARRWWAAAAAGAHAEAAYALARSYLLDGAEPDLARARGAFTVAHELGRRDAGVYLRILSVVSDEANTGTLR